MSGSEGLVLKPIDEMEALHHGAVKLAGAELGFESFGMQVLDLPAGFAGDPEHDHAADGQEEVYVVLHGFADFEIGGERVRLEPGRMLWIAPSSRRRVDPGPDGVRILAVGSTRGSYERPHAFRLEQRS